MHDAETVSWVAVTTTVDELGNSTTSDAEAVEVLALVAARSSNENADSRQPAVIVGKTLYLLDSSAEPGPSDWFTIRGDRYEVEGEPHRWGSSGVEVAVTKAAPRP